MRIRDLFSAGLIVAGILVQAGCSKESASSPETATPEQAAAAKGEGSSATAPASGSANAPAKAPVARVPEPIPPPKPVILAAGTPVVVRTTSVLSTKTQETGQAFTAHLDQPLVVDGRQVAPKGAEVEGRIIESDQGGRVNGRASLSVQVTKLHIADGRVVEISTDTVTRVANTSKSKDAIKVGIGSGVGAAIGAIAGGGKGAAIGAGVGAGAGTGAVLATRGDPAVIASESVLQFALKAPVTLTDLK